MWLKCNHSASCPVAAISLTFERLWSHKPRSLLPWAAFFCDGILSQQQKWDDTRPHAIWIALHTQPRKVPSVLYLCRAELYFREWIRYEWVLAGSTDNACGECWPSKYQSHGSYHPSPGLNNFSVCKAWEPLRGCVILSILLCVLTLAHILYSITFELHMIAYVHNPSIQETETVEFRSA